jgi:bacterioferritin (cytochrome b1)
MEMQMVKELMLQSLKHEMGGTKVYETALKCVVNEDLKEEWEEYLEQTEKHVQVLLDACLLLGRLPAA